MSKNEFTVIDDEDEFDYFKEKYYKFENLLLYFLINIDKSDDEVIKIFVNVPSYGKAKIAETIRQGKAVLKLYPFPYEWIAFTTSGNKEIKNKVRFKEWVEKIIMSLEEEAIKIGKLEI